MPRTSLSKVGAVRRRSKVYESATPTKSVNKRTRKLHQDDILQVDISQESKPCITKDRDQYNGSKTSQSENQNYKSQESDLRALARLEVYGLDDDSTFDHSSPKGSEKIINQTPKSKQKETLINANESAEFLYEDFPEESPNPYKKHNLPAFPTIKSSKPVTRASWDESNFKDVPSNIKSPKAVSRSSWDESGFGDVPETKTPIRGKDSSNESDNGSFENNDSRNKISLDDESGPLDSPVRSCTRQSPPRQNSPMRLCPIQFPPTPIMKNAKFWTGEKVQTIKDLSSDENDLDEAEDHAAAKPSIIERRLKSCMGPSYLTITEISTLPKNPMPLKTLDPPLLYLPLPTKLRELNDCFKCILIALSSQSNIVWDALYDQNFIQLIQRINDNRRLSLSHIQQIMWLVPDLIQMSWTKPPNYNNYMLKIQLNKLSGKKIDCLAYRTIFRSMSVLWTALHHDAMLVSLNPPINPPNLESMQGWHPDFQLEEVSTLPFFQIPPKPEKSPTRFSLVSDSDTPIRLDTQSNKKDKSSLLPPSLRSHLGYKTPIKNLRSTSRSQSISTTSNDREASPVSFKTPNMLKLKDRAEKLREAKEIRDLLSCEDDLKFNEMQYCSDVIRVLESINSYFGNCVNERVVLLPVIIKYITKLPLKPPISYDQANRAILTLCEYNSPVISLSDSTSFEKYKVLRFNPIKKELSKLIKSCQVKLSEKQAEYSKCQRELPKDFKKLWIQGTLSSKKKVNIKDEAEAWESCPSPFRIQPESDSEHFSD